jgi:endonuclease-3
MLTSNTNKVNKANKILHILQNDFSIPKWLDSQRTTFQTLIRTVLSQATASRNATRAFENLSRKFSITPQSLVKANVKDIEEAIKVAGLYRNKSKVIKNISQVIWEQFNGSLDFIYTSPLEEARKILLTIPGVGPKTADVTLLFCAKKPTIPIDTHVNRVSKRLGLVLPKADYEETRRSLQSLYQPEDYLAVHLLLIALGRKYCKAKKPLCKLCSVSESCPSKHIED